MKINLNEMHGFNWTEISYLDFSISNSFSALRKLNVNQEKLLSESKSDLEAKINSIREYNKGGEQEFIESYIHHITYDDEIMIEEIKRLQRYSLVVTIFSFYEARLKSLCEMIEVEFNFKIKINDLNSYKGDLLKYWTYLSKVYEMPTESLQELFDPLIRQKKIRNIIVHQDGIISEKHLKEIPNTHGICFKKSGSLYVLEIEENIYVEFLLKNIMRFFESLLKEIDKKYIQLKST
ncbi:hypothetical protein CLV94_2406 [Flavobacterium endophyticum]|uniref:Cthe-2314-like HEPN domain-containing protein n=1 Tax=Flavobacterium endophyticum TaxID=1540163 RepID=A0A495M706_9FLAO|nr:hypothetical protein [Flavobacterium endophyticum]RKS21771.1 hypothetical protein CLV94_2406 [Flavobacterium endophyticum]